MIQMLSYRHTFILALFIKVVQKDNAECIARMDLNVTKMDAKSVNVIVSVFDQFYQIKDCTSVILLKDLRPICIFRQILRSMFYNIISTCVYH